MYEKIRVIVNPAAGLGRPILSTLNDAFQQTDIDWDIQITTKSGHAKRLCADALDNNVDAIAVYGGDGTVAEVASCLNNSGVPLAILPGGTGNLLSHELGIPIRLSRAIRLLTEGPHRLRTIDMGMTDDFAFLVGIATGFVADVMRQTDREMKTRWGFLSYYVSSLRVLAELRVSHFSLVLDGKPVETDGISCLIANVVNLGRLGISLTPAVAVDDGLFDVLIIRRADVPNIRAIAEGVISPADGLPEPIQHWRAKEVSLTASPSQPLTYDGEYLEPQSVKAWMQPSALQVIVPDITP